MPFRKGDKKPPTSGRRRGQPNNNTAEIKALAFEIAPKAIAELARLALHAENEAVQVAACKELLDRAIGRAVQPHTGEGAEGPVIIQVVTGVPRATEQGF
jgi:hypothetical protein